jgi:hypothetical protein
VSQQSSNGQIEEPMKRKEAVIKEMRQKESMVVAGQSMIDDGSKSQF